MLACILFVFAGLIQWVESIKTRSSDTNLAPRCLRVCVTKREPKCNSRKCRIEWQSLKQINVGQICKPQRPGMLRFCSESSTTYPRCRRWPQRQLSSLQRSSGGDQHTVEIQTLTSAKVSSTYCRIWTLTAFLLQNWQVLPGVLSCPLHCIQCCILDCLPKLESPRHHPALSKSRCSLY